MLPTAYLRPMLDAAATLAGLPSWTYEGRGFPPGCVLEGLVLTESAGNARARRYEAHQDRAERRDAPSDPDTHDVDDGELEDDASYGLMQVMGYNVRNLCGVPSGTPMRFGWLYLPQANVAFGLRILLGELAAVAAEVKAGATPSGHDLERALARYNGGPTGDDLVGEGDARDYRLRAYVDKVAKNAVLALRDRS